MKRPYRSHCFCTNMRRASQVITEYYTEKFREVGLTASQYYILINISRLKAVTAGKLAEHIGLERSTLVRNVAVLARKGLVAAAESETGLKKAYTLTERGAETLAAAQQIWDAAQSEMQTYLGQDDAAALMRVAEKLQTLRWSDER